MIAVAISLAKGVTPKRVVPGHAVAVMGHDTHARWLLARYLWGIAT